MPVFSEADYRWMAHALRLAKKGLYTTDPNPRVGCVLVNPKGNLIGEGWHQWSGQGHAEVNAIDHAGGTVSGATAYVTLEPCCHHGHTPPCTDALIQAGIQRVVVAMQDPNPQVSGKGVHTLEAAGMAVQTGLMEEQARALNPGFISRMTRQRPYVRIKTAMTLDGQTALSNGASQWITGAAARRDVHRLRARSSAVLTGSGTQQADDPRLTVRLEDGFAYKTPLRVLLDSRLRIADNAALLNDEANTWVFTATGTAESRSAILKAGRHRVLQSANTDGQIDLQDILKTLAKAGINELLVEAGATLNGRFLSLGLVDEVVVYMTMKLFGEQGKSAWGHLGQGGRLQRIDEACRLHLTDVRQVGEDIRLTLKLDTAG